MTHLYRHFDKDGDLLYVGISLSTVHRLGQHQENSHWFESITRVEIERFPTREAALQAEAMAIKHEKPLHNVMHNKPKKETLAEKLAHAQRSHKDLITRIVQFNLLYTFQEIAQLLSIGPAAVNRLVDEKRIGSLTLPRKEGLTSHGTPYKEKRVISGWQLISYLESLHEEAI